MRRRGVFGGDGRAPAELCPIRDRTAERGEGRGRPQQLCQRLLAAAAAAENRQMRRVQPQAEGCRREVAVDLCAPARPGQIHPLRQPGVRVFGAQQLPLTAAADAVWLGQALRPEDFQILRAFDQQQPDVRVAGDEGAGLDAPVPDALVPDRKARREAHRAGKAVVGGKEAHRAALPFDPQRFAPGDVFRQSGRQRQRHLPCVFQPQEAAAAVCGKPAQPPVRQRQLPGPRGQLTARF